jgi:phospholipid/cholesterol/gamma-HCH transport system ATP-binding protein
VSEEGDALVFDQVGVAGGSDRPALDGVTFRLGPGGLGLVYAPDRAARRLLADLAEGMAEPDHGQIVFRGQDWRSAGAGAAVAGRAGIGRVFEDTAWVSNLDVDENVTLAQRHHTNRTLGEIDRQARDLAVAVGLTELPKGRPVWVSRGPLQLAQWVRALLGAPSLVILEEPLAGLSADAGERCREALAAARGRGAAALWITGQAEWLGKESLAPDFRVKVLGGRCEPWLGSVS